MSGDSLCHLVMIHAIIISEQAWSSEVWKDNMIAFHWYKITSWSTIIASGYTLSLMEVEDDYETARWLIIHGNVSFSTRASGDILSHVAQKFSVSVL